MASDSSRRDFLTTLAATAATASLGGLAVPTSAAGQSAPKAAFDDTWTVRVAAAKHKAVFDGPEVNDGMALVQPWVWRRSYEVMGAAPQDIVPVVVLRHAAAVLGLDDALWAKYHAGTLRKIDDPATGKPAERNPWSRTTTPSPDPVFQAAFGAGYDGTVEGIVKAGGVVLVCNLALTRIATALSKQTGTAVAAILEEFHAGMVPGALPQPSGVYATLRAQEVGAVFLRST